MASQFETDVEVSDAVGVLRMATNKERNVQVSKPKRTIDKVSGGDIAKIVEKHSVIAQQQKHMWFLLEAWTYCKRLKVC